MMSGQITENGTTTGSGRERRATERARKTWAGAHDGDHMPRLDHLSIESHQPGDVERDMFTENQFMIMFDPDTSNTVVIYYGNDLPNLLGRRNVGNSLHHVLPAALKDIFTDACREAVERGDAVYRDGMISTQSGAGSLYRGIFMPLRSSSQPGRIYIYGAFSNEQGAAALLAA